MVLISSWSERVRSRFLGIGLLAALLFPSYTQAVPVKVPYSGQLSEAGSPVNGMRDLSVSLYAVPTGGAPVYAEAFPATAVQNGVYHLMLNVPGSVWDGSDRWLAISVNGGPQLEPRVRVGTVPYAVRSSSAAHANVADALVSPPSTGASWQTVFSGATTIPAGAWVNVGTPLVITTSGGPLLIVIDVYATGGSHATFQPVVNGLWAGSYSGMLNTGDPFWKEGLQFVGPTGYQQWNKAKVYPGIPGGTYTVRIQGATDSGTLTVGAGSVTGTLSVIELKP